MKFFSLPADVRIDPRQDDDDDSDDESRDNSSSSLAAPTAAVGDNNSESVYKQPEINSNNDEQLNNDTSNTSSNKNNNNDDSTNEASSNENENTTFKYTRQMFILMKGFKHIEDLVPVDYFASGSFDIKLDNNVVRVIYKLRQSCRHLERYYGGTILQVARLSNVGYAVRWDRLDKKLANNFLFQRWMVMTQLCQPLLRMVIKKSTDPKYDHGDPNAQVLRLTIDTSAVMLPSTAAAVASATATQTATPAATSAATATGETHTDEYHILNYGDTFDELEPDIRSRLVTHKWSRKIMRMLVKKAAKKMMSKVQMNFGHTTDSLDHMIWALSDKVEPEDQETRDVPQMSGARKYNAKSFSTHNYITDNSDATVQYSSFLVGKKFGLAMSCVVGIVMAAVFITFAFHAAIHWFTQLTRTSSGGEVELDMNELRKQRDARVNKVKQSLYRKLSKNLPKNYKL